MSDLQQVVEDYKSGLISMNEAKKRIKQISDEMEMLENGQEELALDNVS